MSRLFLVENQSPQIKQNKVNTNSRTAETIFSEGGKLSLGPHTLLSGAVHLITA